MWKILTGWGSFGLEAVPHYPSNGCVEEGSGLRKINRPEGRHDPGWAPAASVQPVWREWLQMGGSISPCYFPFTLFIGFKNDFIVESEQTRADLPAPPHTHINAYIRLRRGPQTHVCTNRTANKGSNYSSW